MGRREFDELALKNNLTKFNKLKPVREAIFNYYYWELRIIESVFMYIIFLLIISVYKFDEKNQYNTSSCVYVEVPLIPQSLRYELYSTLMTSRM
jgi:hypothetical protein